MTSSCFHCDLPVPAGLVLTVPIDGVERPMCCYGCAAVARAIVDAGQAQFYRLRTEPQSTAREAPAESLRGDEVYDSESLQDQLVRPLDEHEREVSLMLDGITCAACVWLIEQSLSALPGINRVGVNYASQRAWVRWDQSRLRLSQILQAVQRIGYRAIPYDPAGQQQLHQQQRRTQLRRLAVAGLFGMQVMMLSISLYAGAWSGMERDFAQLFRWLGFILTVPVVAYAGYPFFAAAWRDLGRRRVGMDVSVSLAVGIAFASSALATLRGHGEIYFDSVVMFIFFLSASRYFESMARQRSAAAVERLVQSVPLTATRLAPDGEDASAVAAASLVIGNRILIRPGETVPADGEILLGSSSLDESLLSGESLPQARSAGDRVIGGSVNLDQPLQVTVTATGADTVLAEIQRMMERAQADRPPLARLADRVAAVFVSAVLVIVAGVAAFWWFHDSARWFEIALAVLIVSCPCALALATPAAISASLGRMQTAGLLVKRGAVLERLNPVSHVVFDKTGTLTLGQPVLHDVVCEAGFSRSDCLELAAALEKHSEHPLAKAIAAAGGAVPGLAARNVENSPGGGIRGNIDGRDYFIGSRDFVCEASGAAVPPEWLERLDTSAHTAVFLADGQRLAAMFSFSDRARDDAAGLIAQIKRQGRRVLLMSGDRYASVRELAENCGIDEYQAEMLPEDKLRAVAELQRQGARVLMVGDGINDAPVLSRADVSIAMGGATALARIGADIVLLKNRLNGIAEAFAQAARTQRVVRQNLAWALTYNFCAIPAAALGLVAPWTAAIGMSLSSLLVVANAMRLTR